MERGVEQNDVGREMGVGENRHGEWNRGGEFMARGAGLEEKGYGEGNRVDEKRYGKGDRDGGEYVRRGGDTLLRATVHSSELITAKFCSLHPHPSKRLFGTIAAPAPGNFMVYSAAIWGASLETNY